MKKNKPLDPKKVVEVPLLTLLNIQKDIQALDLIIQTLSLRSDGSVKELPQIFGEVFRAMEESAHLAINQIKENLLSIKGLS